MAAFNIPSSVNEGDTLNISLTGLSPYLTYSLYMTPSHRDDFGDMTIDGNIVTHADNYYDWTPSSNNSSISLPTTLDDQAEAAERVRFYLYSKNGIYRYYEASGSTTINNIRSTEIGIKTGLRFGDTSNPASINEGSSIYYQISNLDPRKYYYYKLTGVSSSDISGSTTGYFYNYSPSGSKQLSFSTTADVLTEGAETIKFELYDSSNYTNLLGSASTTLNDTSTTPVLTIQTGSYSGDTSTPESINEGQYLYYNIKNMQARKYYYYKITGINSSDTSSSLTGSFYNYYTTSSRNISLRTLADVATEGNETIKFELYDSSNYSNLLGSISTTLNDTSKEPQVNLTYGTYNNQNNPSTIAEGTNIAFKLSNLGRKQYYWKFDGISADDIRGATSGNFYSYSYSGSRSIPLNILSDEFTEGNETVTFTLSKDSAHQNQILTRTFTVNDTSQTPTPAIEILDSNIRSNEGESAIIPLKITTFPTEITPLYWKLSGVGLSKSDLATRFGDLSERVSLGSNTLRSSRRVRGTVYRSGSLDLKIPFAKDETTENTEVYKLELFSNASFSGPPLNSADITVYDTSQDPPKSSLNSASIDGKLIQLYFSDPIEAHNLPISSLKINIGSRNIPIDSIILNQGNTSASVKLKVEPNTNEIVAISHIPQRKSLLQSFKQEITVSDLNHPVPIRGVAYEDRIELRFSEKLNDKPINKSLFEIKASNRIKRIQSVDLSAEQGIAVINMSQKIDINDDVEVNYYDLRGDQQNNNLEDKTGNDVQTFRNFQVANETSDTNDISVTLAEVEDSTITLGFDIEIDSQSIPNTGMFRVMINNNKSKIQDISLSSKKREAYLQLKNPVSNGDVIKLTYIDAKGNQKDNIIQSKYGGDLGTFKNLEVENLSAESFDAPDVEDSYYEKDTSSVIIEFDEIISYTKIKNSRLKIYSINNQGKKSRYRIKDILTEADDTYVEAFLKKPLEPAVKKLFFDYRDPKGDQKNGVIQDIQGNDLQNLKSVIVDI